MLWYALDRYIHCVLGTTHLDLPEEEKRRMRLEKGENIDPNKEVLKLQSSHGNPSQVHLTQAELYGLKFIVMYLHHLPHSKKNVPVMLPDPISVIKDIRTLVLSHKDDCPEKAINGKYVLRWTESDDVDGNSKRPRKSLPKIQTPGERKKPGPKPGSTRKPPVPQDDKKNSGNRRRRVRCKICEACVGGDCKQCAFCKDMIKYGGPGKMKQTCEKVRDNFSPFCKKISFIFFFQFQRRCLHPQLPVCAYCSVCKLDGWGNEPKVQGKETDRPEEAPNLFECTVCLDILHPKCAEQTIGLGQVNNELSNSWECAKCVNSGYSSAPSRAAKRTTPPTDEVIQNEAKKTRPDTNMDVAPH